MHSSGSLPVYYTFPQNWTKNVNGCKAVRMDEKFGPVLFAYYTGTQKK